MRKFLVILDDTRECLNAMRFAALRAAHTGGGVTILSIIPPEEFQHWMGVADLMRAEARERIEAHFEVFAKWMRDRQGINPELVIREGDPVTEILAQVKEDPEIGVLVLGAVATGAWALFASVVAIWASELGSLIEVVNRFGSFFYGSILGVFMLAILWPRANGNGAFVGLLSGMATVAWVATQTSIGFLWHNLIGAVAVFIVGVAVSAVTGGVPPSDVAQTQGEA